MRKDLRNDFTDALNEEILSRKIFDKAKTPEEENIFLAETKIETVAKPEVKNSKPKKKIKKSKPKISEEKISSPKIETPKKITAENDFEERVFAEAENDFYEEKISEIGKHMRYKVEEKKNFAPIFHSKDLQKDIQDPDEENSVDDDPELYRKLSRAEMAGVTLSALMLAYSFLTMDKPLFFLAMSLISHLMRPPVGRLFGKHNRAVQNAMRSFSLVLFFGAILFVFI